MVIAVIATVHRCEPIPDEADAYTVEFMWVVPGINPAGGDNDTIVSVEVANEVPLETDARYSIQVKVDRIVQTPIPFDFHMYGTLLDAEPVKD